MIIIAVGVAIPPPRPQPERRSTVIEVIGRASGSTIGSAGRTATSRSTSRARTPTWYRRADGHDHLLRTGLAEITDPDPPAPSRLRAADRAYQTAFDDVAHYAHLAA